MLETEQTPQELSHSSDDWDLIADLNDEDIEDDLNRKVNDVSPMGFQDMDFPPLAPSTKNSSKTPFMSHRIASYPEMGSFTCCNESESSMSRLNFDEISTDVTCASDAPVLVNFSGGTSTSMPMVKKMSFKDMMMLNAEDQAKRETKLQQRNQPKSSNVKPKKFSPKFVVRPIKRNAHSTGELPRLAEVSDICESEGGGGGGGSGLATVTDGEVLGATDAEDFYARKNHGAKTHRNGQRCRPDEAKRKEFSQHKRAMQKEAQRARGR